MIWKREQKRIEVPLLEYLEDLIKTEKAMGRELRVAVGTDSQRNGRNYKFATVILFVIKENLGGGVWVGRGGKMVYADYSMSVHSKRKEGVNERMLQEVSKSIEVAYEIAPLMDKYGIKMEVHADINPDPRWESNKALKEAVGYILGMGYEFKLKPNSIASTYCADHLI
jgi:uncharacterized protein